MRLFPASFASSGKHDNAAIYSVVLMSYAIFPFYIFHSYLQDYLYFPFVAVIIVDSNLLKVAFIFFILSVFLSIGLFVLPLTLPLPTDSAFFLDAPTHLLDHSCL